MTRRVAEVHRMGLSAVDGRQTLSGMEGGLLKTGGRQASRASTSFVLVRGRRRRRSPGVGAAHIVPYPIGGPGGSLTDKQLLGGGVETDRRAVGHLDQSC